MRSIIWADKYLDYASSRYDKEGIKKELYFLKIEMCSKCLKYRGIIDRKFLFLNTICCVKCSYSDFTDRYSSVYLIMA